MYQTLFTKEKFEKKYFNLHNKELTVKPVNKNTQKNTLTARKSNGFFESV